MPRRQKSKRNGRTEFTYYPGMVRIPEGRAPDFKNKSYRITADVDIPAGGAAGMLLTQGGRFNGLGLYILKGKPVFYYNLVGVERTVIEGKNALTPGKHSIDLSFKYDGGGIGKGGLVTLGVDGQKVAEHQLTRGIPSAFRQMRPLTSGEIRGLRSAKTTTCHSNLPVRSTKLWSS